MRLSVIKGDPGFARNTYNVTVTLNGEQIRTALTADEEERFVEVMKMDHENRVVLKDGGEIDTVRLTGDVKITVPEGWYPIK